MKNCWYNGLELFEMIDKLDHIEDWQKDILKMEIESMNHKEIPMSGTNGDMIGALFPKAPIFTHDLLRYKNLYFTDEWWNAPYERGEEDG